MNHFDFSERGKARGGERNGAARKPKSADGKKRKSEILDAAVKVAERVGYHRIRRDEVAKEAGCSEGTVSEYGGTMNQLKNKVWQIARKTGNLKIIGRAHVNGDRRTATFDKEFLQQAVNSLVE